MKAGAAEVINGELFVDMGKIKKNNILSDLELSQLDDSLDDIKSHIATVYEGTYEIAKNLAQAYIDEQVDATQAIIDELDKRKEAYENYFDELDSLDEEEERASNKDSIVQQIEALTGALDSSSKSKIKDLQQQLKDLQDEELDAQRQKQRDALTASLDKQTEKLNNNITNLNNSLGKLTEQLIKNTNAKTDAINIIWDGKDWTVTTTQSKPETATNKSYRGSRGNSNVSYAKAYASGGLVNYTGPAWVDGSRSKPEAFLSSIDTILIRNLIDSLKMPSLYTSDSNSGNINIDRIDIHTDHLDNNQDFANAGETLADAFSNAIRRRGINTNARK